MPTTRASLAAREARALPKANFMLTAETKRRINSARDILVGQLPLPTDQVELITIALIYKFMDDIDEEARSIGGKSGDILISSRGTIGKIAIVREGQDFNIMGNIILLRPNQALLASHYLAVQLLHLRESIESNAHGVAQKGLYLSTVRDFTISVPPLAEQRAMVAELETERALVEANRELAVRSGQKLQTKLSEIWGA
jgi:restriction endonuclease S subunit